MPRRCWPPRSAGSVGRQPPRVRFRWQRRILLAAGRDRVTHGMRSASLGQAIGDMIVAAAAQIPAMWLIVAVGVTLFGAAPKLSVASWGVAGLAPASACSAPSSTCPSLLDLSPFSHVPKLPAPR